MPEPVAWQIKCEAERGRVFDLWITTIDFYQLLGILIMELLPIQTVAFIATFPSRG